MDFILQLMELYYNWWIFILNMLDFMLQGPVPCAMRGQAREPDGETQAQVKNDDFFIETDDFCIKNDEFRIKNDELCI